MVPISAVSLIIWVIVGLINLINCISHHKCTWVDYWLAYSVLIITLINQLVDELV